MAISRNSLGSLNVAQLQAKMNELSALVDDAVAPGKDVDIASLAAKIDAKNDPILSSAFERVTREYSRLRGPSEGPVPQRSTIESKDVHSVMNMLIEAKQALSDLDKDGDGSLDRSEVLQSRFDPKATYGEGIADGAARGANLTMEQSLDAVLFKTSNKGEMKRRFQAYHSLRQQVAACAPSEEGEGALLAHLKTILIDQKTRVTNRTAEKTLHKVLKKAEHSFFRRLFGAPKLSDKEVAELIGTSDLKGYAEQSEAKIKTEYGASFEEVWLDGQDLDAQNQIGIRFKPEPS